MAVYEYKAINPKGKNITGIINAESPGDARLKVRKLNYFLTDLKEVESEEGGSKERKFGGIRNAFRWVKPQEIALFSRQMSTLLQAGLPLVDALTALIEQFEDSGFKRVLLQVREKVNEGVSLADALSEHRRYFSPLYIGMVRSGEASGALALVLTRLAEFLEKQAELNSKVRSTLAYPVIMTFVGFAILGFLFAYVIPKVTAIFEQTNQALPLPTLMLIKISVIVRNYWYLIIIFCFVIYYVFKYFINTEKGR
ncbi:MAG: type II secretion system protein GspF, partial [Candidatus Schekmanbacteria bacterium]